MLAELNRPSLVSLTVQRPMTKEEMEHQKDMLELEIELMGLRNEYAKSVCGVARFNARLEKYRWMQLKELEKAKQSA